MAKVFIDGSAGTTGLQIHGRLAARRDITLLTLDEAHRKDPAARRQALNAADIVLKPLEEGYACRHPLRQELYDLAMVLAL